MGDCIDVVGDLDSDCTLCIGSSTSCDYFSQCQRSLVTCVLPSAIAPPGTIFPDAGTSPDAGGSSVPSTTSKDAGSD